MAKREKILLVVVGLVALYFVYTTFLSGEAQEKKAQSTVSVAKLYDDKKMDEIIAKANKVADEYKVNDREAHLLELAETSWERMPFFDRAKDRVPEAVEEETVLKSAENLDLHYTGLVVMGDKKLAIINGLEYELMEELEVGGYYLTAIEEEQVILGQINSKGELVDKLTVPLEEDELNLFN